ncbi:hypothetical protein ACFQX6_16165 [Streptosporangium lutulentum]
MVDELSAALAKLVTMKNTTVLISGASIADPALAYWLNRYGCTVTIVEKAPALRAGGQAVDFKGATHLTVLERMGILEEVRRHRTGGTDQTIVDANGRKLAVMPGEFSGGDLEILRGDLAALLYDKTSESCEHVFGDSVTSLTETAAACTSPSSAAYRAPSTSWWARTASIPTCGAWPSAPNRSTCAFSATTTPWPTWTSTSVPTP